jgi:ceramide glucosyltransferase
VIAAALGLLVAAGLALMLMTWRCRRALLDARPPVSADPRPPVSVLKPLCGFDPGLEGNLETFFTQDYPDYEIVFGVEDPYDPALGVARRVAARHPRVRASFVADPSTVGLNPKVNNLANMLPRARHETLLVSDSNVAVTRDYLRVLVAHLQPGTMLVSSLFRGAGARGLGGALEALQINAFVTGAVAAAHLVAGVPCVVGKSMLLRRADLESIGGFRFLARYLAEDQVCGEEFAQRGGRLAVCGAPIDNVLGTRSLAEFVDRHLRWCRIRVRISAAAYAAEPLLNPVFLALIACALAPGWATAACAAATLLAASLLGATAERDLGVRRPLTHYPLLELARATITGLLWPVPFFSSRIRWRGHHVTIGSRTFIEPENAINKLLTDARPSRGVS